MCDCYDHKCEYCEETIPMHIGDFAYPREDFKVYCFKHINQALPGTLIFELTENEDDDIDKFEIGWKCAIFGPEVGGSNHPNLGGDFKTEVAV